MIGYFCAGFVSYCDEVIVEGVGYFVWVCVDDVVVSDGSW